MFNRGIAPINSRLIGVFGGNVGRIEDDRPLQTGNIEIYNEEKNMITTLGYDW